MTMADIFISYAREDQDFVRKLQEALEEHKRNTWVDWKDIPLTAKWKEEVFSAIDNSDSFAAVISPDFIVSEPCRDHQRRRYGTAGRHYCTEGEEGSGQRRVERRVSARFQQATYRDVDSFGIHRRLL